MVPKYLKGCCMEMEEIIRVASDARKPEEGRPMEECSNGRQFDGPLWERE